ncbi:ABC-2 family transporter protein [Candidatus Curtissbacteria bacterium]|nr:ABC-2 family transporter protein [Candidatus Curtissbacteria bacterium]
MLKKYFKIWLLMTTCVSQIAFLSRFGAVLFIIGKFLRFGFFLLFLIILETQTKGIEGYNLWQVIFFFATFNLIDTLPQLFFREVYRFRSYVVSGQFDFFLTKPLSPLFRSLLGGSDILDLSMIFIAVGFIALSATRLEGITGLSIISYLLLIANALVIAMALHILVISVGVLTTEVDNTIMLYRDITQMGRIPVDVYREPLSFLITFVIPVGVMATFPAKALMGLLTLQFMMISFLISGILLAASLAFWKFSLKNYSSIST